MSTCAGCGHTTAALNHGQTECGGTAARRVPRDLATLGRALAEMRRIVHYGAATRDGQVLNEALPVLLVEFDRLREVEALQVAAIEAALQRTADAVGVIGPMPCLVDVERRAWARLVKAQAPLNCDGPGCDCDPAKEYEAAKQALRDIGVDVDKMLEDP